MYMYMYRYMCMYMYMYIHMYMYAKLRICGKRNLCTCIFVHCKGVYRKFSLFVKILWT